MKITNIGTDFITVTEDNIEDDDLKKISRVHLIELNFSEPTEEKIKNVISLYPKTNRFVIRNNIKIYNYILKSTSKKYYIVNNKSDKLITFFRRNNKVLIDFLCLNDDEFNYATSDCGFGDIINNSEVIIINKNIFDNKIDILNEWNGNVIIK